MRDSVTNEEVRICVRAGKVFVIGPGEKLGDIDDDEEDAVEGD